MKNMSDGRIKSWHRALARFKRIDLLMVFIILVLIALISVRTVQLSNNSSQQAIPNVPQSFSASPAQIRQVPFQAPSSQSIAASGIEEGFQYLPESVPSAPSQSNVFYNEQFWPGNVSYGINSIGGPNYGQVNGCYSLSSITIPHLGVKCFVELGIEICIPWYYSSSSYKKTYNYFNGFVGFPTPATGSQVINIGGISGFPSLSSADVGYTGGTLNLLDYSTPLYFEPTYSTPSSLADHFANYINWSTSTLKEYGSTPYYYAINTSFNVGCYGGSCSSNPSPASPSGTTFIIPSVSCGSTLPNNFVSFDPTTLEDTISAIKTLSGFTPSVGLASQGGSGLSVIYAVGVAFWPFFANILLGENTNSIVYPAFKYGNPSLNYANFPAGNPGDQQYDNVSGFFSTPLFLNGKNVTVYYNNLSISDIQHSANINWESLLGLTSFTTTQLNTFLLENFQQLYYPFLEANGQSLVLAYDNFRTDGIFPTCAWKGNNILENCTFEDPASVNPISFTRIWNSGTSNNLAYQPFSPALNKKSSTYSSGYVNMSLDSFCFYGENFDNLTGVYTPPSITRIIPPTVSENYTSAIGQCNAFFSNTNCFNPEYPNYINLKAGVFVNAPTCSPTGIRHGQVTDAWIKSVYVANSAGQYCGSFDGEKNMSNPLANSTVFLKDISTCPSFNSNDSSVSVVVTVKNVGTTNITQPYLIALFKNSNPSDMFYNSIYGYNTTQQYPDYLTFMSQMETQTTGVIDLRYNSTLQTNEFVYLPGHSLNPVPIQSLFSASKYYVAGPYNNSLVGMWLYKPDPVSGVNVIRTANTFLSYSSSNDSGVPLITPNGTATFTIQVPMSLFKYMLNGKYNLSVYFGNLFNVSWGSGSVPNTARDLTPSGDVNSSQIHNSEYLNPSDSGVGANPSPLWQYMSGTTLNLSSGPFASTSIYSDAVNLSVFAPNATQSLLTLGVNANVMVQNGSGTYNLSNNGPFKDHSAPLGSVISCFASQENVQDFGVFWSVQAVSPSNLNYAVQNFYSINGKVDNVIVNRWRGILFMPYADEVSLNYNNLPQFPLSTTSMSLQKPSLSQSSATPSKQAFVYFGSGNEQSLFNGLGSTSNFLQSSPLLTSASLPSSSYGFTFTTMSLRNNSIIRIQGTRTFNNQSVFAGQTVDLTVVSPGGGRCSLGSYTTNGSAIVSLTTTNLSKCTISSNSELNITSPSGPFDAQLYNTSSLNMTDNTYGGTVLVSSNISFYLSPGYYTTVNISSPPSQFANGLSLSFLPLPLSSFLKNSNVYLYYINGSPFNCNVVNNLPRLKINNAVSQITKGEYFAPNGTVMCYINSSIPPVRAVFFNKSNNEYLGSGDFGLGVTVENISRYVIKVSYDGVPINSQDFNMSQIGGSSCDLKNAVVVNGILNYSSASGGSCHFITNGNYSLNLTNNFGGETTFLATVLRNVTTTQPGSIIQFSPVSVADVPSVIQNMSFISTPASGTPVIFSIPTSSPCSSIKIISASPYPYFEVPYQVISSSPGQCSYVFIGNGNQQTYQLFEGVSSSLVSYQENWANVSVTPYTASISSSNYSATLVANCKPGVGPCISSFSLNNTGNLGELLINNVSSSGTASLEESSYGPVADCFTVSYDASQQVIWPDSGFGSINYNSQKLYQVTNPSESLLSTYCFFNGAKTILDSVISSGSPVTFNIQNALDANFSVSETSNGQTYYVPPPLHVGYGSYSGVVVREQTIRLNKNVNTLNVFQRCQSGQNYQTSSSSSSLEAEDVPIPSSYYSNENNFYCMFGSNPTYSPNYSATSTDNSFTNFPTSGETVGLLYRPGNYNITRNGLNQTLYAACGVTGLIGSSTNTIYENQAPQFYLNGAYSQYSVSNQNEKFIADYTAASLLGDVVINPTATTRSSGILISSCPAGDVIENMTLCTRPASQVVPANGSYDSIEAIPTPATTKYGNYPIGGGCLITSRYSCAPTDGNLSLSKTQSSSSTTSSSSYTMYVPFSTDPNAASPALLSPSPSITCTISTAILGTLSHTKISSGASSSCTYGSSSGGCTISLSGPQNGNLGATCTDTNAISINSTEEVSYSFSINVKSLTYNQSETTGILGNLTCGNLSSAISTNTQGIWNWKPFSTKLTTNSSGVAAVGGCEAGREAFNASQPIINTTNLTNGEVVQSYSCPKVSSGTPFSGTIESCASVSTLTLSGTESTSCNTNSTYYSPVLVTKKLVEAGTATNGATPTSCNAGPSSSGFTKPNLSNGCVSYHLPISSSGNYSYVLQFSNTSGKPYIGVGLGLIGFSSPTNISIPPSGPVKKVRDQYMSSLSVSQFEATNILTSVYPTNLIESKTLHSSLFKSSVYPFDMLNILLLQNPYFGISGVPGFVNGSTYDYVMNIFTGGTSANCIGASINGLLQGDHALYSLREGELCSGQSMPIGYNNGIFTSLGLLNQGLHALQFYSVSETGNTSAPAVNVYDSVGRAGNLNSACPGGSNRVFTSVYAGGKWTFNISADEACNPINNQLYGYIVNCLYQTPLNKTYTIASKYYLAYNLPTVWNISYTLLVSPKSYNVIPVNLYKVSNSYTSFLSLYPPTTFIENGLPVAILKSHGWTVEYGGDVVTSHSSAIHIQSNGNGLFQVFKIQNSSNGCVTTSIPSPSSGIASPYSTISINFTTNTYCISNFTESGLPVSKTWYVTYDGLQKSSASDLITFNTSSGDYVFSVQKVSNSTTTSTSTTSKTCTTTYSPVPSSGSMRAGLSTAVTFSISTSCFSRATTTFIAQNLPVGGTFNVKYDGITHTTTASSTSFTTPVGTYSFTVYGTRGKVGSCTGPNGAKGAAAYAANPSSGSLSAGSTQYITYSQIGCIVSSP